MAPVPLPEEMEEEPPSGSCLSCPGHVPKVGQVSFGATEDIWDLSEASGPPSWGPLCSRTPPPREPLVELPPPSLAELPGRKEASPCQCCSLVQATHTASTVPEASLGSEIWCRQLTLCGPLPSTPSSLPLFCWLCPPPQPQFRCPFLQEGFPGCAIVALGALGRSPSAILV